VDPQSATTSNGTREDFGGTGRSARAQVHLVVHELSGLWDFTFKIDEHHLLLARHLSHNLVQAVMHPNQVGVFQSLLGEEIAMTKSLRMTSGIGSTKRLACVARTGSAP
jgi:hypothetical protein